MIATTTQTWQVIPHHLYNHAGQRIRVEFLPQPDGWFGAALIFQLYLDGKPITRFPMYSDKAELQAEIDALVAMISDSSAPPAPR